MLACAAVLAWSAENEATVMKFHGMRVTDVIDGLDVAGLQDLMVMDPAIRPKRGDEQKLTRRTYGAATRMK